MSKKYEPETMVDEVKMESGYEKVKVWHECPNCKKKILLSLAVKKGNSVIYSEVFGGEE